MKQSQVEKVRRKHAPVRSDVFVCVYAHGANGISQWMAICLLKSKTGSRVTRTITRWDLSMECKRPTTSPKDRSTLYKDVEVLFLRIMSGIHHPLRATPR